MQGLSKCKASESNVRRIQVKDIVKEVKDNLKTYSSAGMDISCKIRRFPASLTIDDYYSSPLTTVGQSV
ncbi:hypothetical protein Tco_1143036 [Tanacetum coccineum]